MKKHFTQKLPVIESGDYTKIVPFNRSTFVTEYKLTTNDVLTPLLGGDKNDPQPLYGSIYRLIGDGVHTPTFSGLFKKSLSSKDYDLTDNVLNLIIFMYDGTDFWYTITQAA
jgi:hypothetical protein